MLPSSPEVLKISLTSPFICLVTVPDASSAPPGPPDLLNRRLPPLVDRDRAFPGRERDDATDDQQGNVALRHSCWRERLQTGIARKLGK